MKKTDFVFYYEGTSGPTAGDAVLQRDDGTYVGQYSGLTLAGYQAREAPKVVAMITYDEYIVIHDKARTTVPEQTTKEQFWEMLEVLPPMGWVRTFNSESFKLSERTSGNITRIMARLGSEKAEGCTYWMFEDQANLPHDQIMAKVIAVATAVPA